MTINVSQHYNKHIKHLDQNTFVYKVKKAFYLLTNQEERLYEVGSRKDFYMLQIFCKNNQSKIAM